MTHRSIHFLLNDQVVRMDDFRSDITVLQYLRETLGHIGTKEGCASGDCGACSVVVAELIDGEIQYRAINACITFLQSLQGKQVITVEDLKRNNSLHAVQQAMVDEHGSQCGFCTPGFVMSLFALSKKPLAKNTLLEEASSKKKSSSDREDIYEALSGNLCRCTGYRSIVDAAMQIQVRKDSSDQFSRDYENTRQQLSLINDARHLEHFSPTNIIDLARLAIDYPKATLLAGGTDLALQLDQAVEDFETVIYLGKVAELLVLEISSRQIKIGAALTYTHCRPQLAQEYPALGQMIGRLGSLQIRNQGTIGGNIANASPVGDMPPVLMVLGATITLHRGGTERKLALENYFVAYKESVLQSSEFIRSIAIPRAKEAYQLKVYKVSKRFDDDISAVLGAFYVCIENSKVKAISIAFGGMAAIPKRAKNCEAALLAKVWNQKTIDAAKAALMQDYIPLSDMRASALYRMRIAKNLLQKCYLEITYPNENMSVLAEQVQVSDV